MNALRYAAALSALAVLSLMVLGAAAPEKPPAQFKPAGEFTGGTSIANMVLSGVRFGAYDDYTRMVLDFEAATDGGRGPATAHPVYRVAYLPYPYRLAITMEGVAFDPQAKIQSKPALPFSVVAEENGSVKEMQVFLSGPCEFKVIEIDDPAKLCIDVKPLRGIDIPTVYTVQLTDAHNAQEAYALVAQGNFPAGYTPHVLVLGALAVVEQVFREPGEAARMEEALRGLGYATVINERRGDELPQT